MKKEARDYLNNVFSIDLLRSLSVSTREMNKRPGYQAGKNNHHLLTGPEKYQSRVFKIQGDLGSTLEQFSFIRTFVQRHPNKKYYAEHGISQLEYIQYHMEALFHKVHTVCEIMKLMVNEVYQLQIPPKDCSWLTITKKISKKEPSLQNIDAYYKSFAQMIESRHLNSHRGLFYDKEKDKIELDYGYSFYKFEQMGFPIDEDLRRAYPMVYIDYAIKEYKKSRLELIDKVIDYSGQIVQAFLGNLKQPYDKQLELIEKAAPTNRSAT